MMKGRRILMRDLEEVKRDYMETFNNYYGVKLCNSCAA